MITKINNFSFGGENQQMTWDQIEKKYGWFRYSVSHYEINTA